MRNYVIVGNSAAAIGAVEAIRRLDTEGSVTLVSSEPYHTYSRPLISYYLCGKTDLARMRYRGESFYADNNCKTLFGVRAEAIDTKNRALVLQSGEALPYDRLLVATGSSPAVPPIPGLDGVENRFTFSCLDDALALEKALRPDARALILGAGLIGLKCAEGIRDRVGSVTVVDFAPQILPSILDADGAAVVQKNLEAEGLRFYLAESVRAFEGNCAQLSGGGRVDFDLLVTATGVRPNVALVRDAGGTCGRGIQIDFHGRTDLEDIYAAGDCTESVDMVSGKPSVMAVLPNAYMQGACAGANMAGGDETFDRAMALNSIGLFGTHIMTAGAYTGECRLYADGGSYKKLFYRDDRLVGFILIGETDAAGIYTSLIREKTPLDSIDFDLVCEHPSLLAFSRADRNIKLGSDAS